MTKVTSLPSAQLWAQLLSIGAVPDDDFDEDSAGDLARELQRRGEPEVLEWALPQLDHPHPWHRQAAAWVLEQLGYERGRPYGEVVAPALVAAADRELDPDTRFHLVEAVGFAGDPRWAADLMRYATDPDPRVRGCVARQLPGMYAGDDPAADAINALIGLSRDPQPYVRDWATMALGTQCDVDTPAVREALHARLRDHETTDEDEQDHGTIATSAEALLGLARRHDPTVFDLLKGLLEVEDVADVGNLTVEAAGEYGDRRLLPALIKLRDDGWADHPDEPQPGQLAHAIAALEAVETTDG